MTGVPTREAGRNEALSRRIGSALVGIAVLAVALALGLTVTKVGATRTGSSALDESIAQHRDAVLTAVALVINVGFGTLVAPLLLLVTCGTLWFRNRFAALAIGVLTIIGWFSVEVGKVLVHRPRPPAAAVHALVSETAPTAIPAGTRRSRPLRCSPSSRFSCSPDVPRESHGSSVRPSWEPWLSRGSTSGCTTSPTSWRLSSSPRHPCCSRQPSLCPG